MIETRRGYLALQLTRVDKRFCIVAYAIAFHDEQSTINNILYSLYARLFHRRRAY